MKNRINTQKILSVLLAALVVFSSLGFGSFTTEVQAEETAGPTVMPRYEDTDTRVHITKSDKWHPNISFDFYQTGTTTLTADNWSANADTSWYTSDTGAAAYTLYNARQLAGLAQLVNAGKTTFQDKTITLGQSIDLSEHYWDAVIGNATNKFNGTFDGNGFSVAGLRINKTVSVKEDTNSGLFGETGSTATVANLTMADVMISLVSSAGGAISVSSLVSVNDGQINNCHVEGGRIYGNSQNIRLSALTGATGVNSKVKNCTISGQTVMYSVCKKVNAQDKGVCGIIGGFVADNASTNPIENCVSNGKIVAYTAGGDTNGNTMRHFIGGCIGNNTGVDAKGQVLNSTNNGDIEVHADGNTCGYTTGRGLNIGGVAAVTGTKTSGCVNTGDIYVDGAQKVNADYGGVGGIAGTMGYSGSGDVLNCYNTGKITTNHPTVGGIFGYMSGGNINYCYNTGEITTTGFGAATPATQYVGGMAGSVANGSVNGSYSVGTIAGEDPNNKNDNKGGLTGKAGGTFTNCFYLGAGKASGDGNSSGTAINLAAIKKTASGDVVTQVKQGDDSAMVMLADASQLSALSNESALGANFGVQLPAASAFVSSDTGAVQAITGADNTVALKTSGGTGGRAVLSAKMYLNQNELVDGQFIGGVKSIEAPITLDLNVVYVGLSNKSPTSAIKGMTDYSLKAKVAFGGVEQSDYTLKWFKSDNAQDTPPDNTVTGSEVTGLTEVWNDAAGEATWTKTGAKFSETDAGWYKLKATTSTTGLMGYDFETNWQYLTVDDLMVFNKDSSTPDTIELSGNDNPAEIQKETTLSVKIEIASAFEGSITYGWYKVDESPIKLIGEPKTATIGASDLHTIEATQTISETYNDNLKGSYQLIVTSVTPTDGTEQPKDIRGPSSTIVCYNAIIKDDYAQSGPGYEGTPGNTMTQSIITLSEDFKAAMYDAYWIKGGQLNDKTDLSDYTQVRHATLTDQGDGTYKAIATFTMEKGYEGTDYQLVIYPTNTIRNSLTDEAMQFKGVEGCVLNLYAIDTVTYALEDSYSTTEMVNGEPIILPPEVAEPNPAGAVTYEKTSGSSSFGVAEDGTICLAENTDPKTIANGLYTIGVKVTETGFRVSDSPDSPPLSGPGMSKTVNVSFLVTGSSDFPLNKNLYIYDTGYILADSKPDTTTTNIIPYKGIYNIPAPGEGKNEWTNTVTVVSGTHTDKNRVTLNGSIAAGTPVKVEANAAVEIETPATAVTLTGESGPAIQTDGDLTLTGAGSLSVTGTTAGIGGNGAFSLKGATLTATGTTGPGINIGSITIESGQITAGGSGNIGIEGSAITITGGNVNGGTVQNTNNSTVTIDGGSITSTVINPVNSNSEPLYPVTLNLSATPSDYKDKAMSVTQAGADNIPKNWKAKASSEGQLFVYLPHYDPTALNDYTAIQTNEDIEIPTAYLYRNIRANTDGKLETSLLPPVAYTVEIPKNITGSANLGHGAFADFSITLQDTKNIIEGRTVSAEVLPVKGYQTIWGNFKLNPPAGSGSDYAPAYQVQTPDNRLLTKEGPFGTMDNDSRTTAPATLSGKIVVPAASQIIEGTYTTQIGWRFTATDPVVGGEN